MKISDIKVYPTWVGNRNQLLVKIETDEGVYGWGESGVSGRELAVKGAVEHYRQFLIGRDPLATEFLWDIMHRKSVHGRQGEPMMAISLIDNALWDLKGKWF